MALTLGLGDRNWKSLKEIINKGLKILVIGVLIRRRDINTQTYTGKCHVTIEAKIGVMCIQAREQRGLLATPVAKRKEWNRLFPRIFRKGMALSTLDFELVASRNVRE